MSGANPALICVPLADQIILRRICYWHETSIGSESGLFASGWQVVVRSSGIPYEQIARFGAKLLPFIAICFQPLHSVLSEAVPLWRPSWDSFFIGEFLVKLLRNEMAALADNQTAIVRAVGQQVDETLETSESWLSRVLILMGPWLILGDVLATVSRSQSC